MKIGPSSEENKSEVASATAPRKAKTQEGTASAGVAVGSAKAEASAQVEISSTARAGGERGDVAEFDQAKVDRIATAIREGKFTVNAEAIADKLITNAQELLGRSH